jgi:hypothetical protein
MLNHYSQADIDGFNQLADRRNRLAKEYNKMMEDGIGMRAKMRCKTG